MSKKVLVLLIFLVVVIAFLVLRKKPILNVASYDECVQAGFPVTESYPAQCNTPEGKSFTQDIGNELEKQDLIIVDDPRPNTEVVNPIIVRGKARGNWFFEASFPIRLIDENGNELGRAIAQAEGEWMTTEFVPFTTNLNFSTLQTKKGKLILEKDNPSGMSENSDELIIPVFFKQD